MPPFPGGWKTSDKARVQSLLVQLLFSRQLFFFQPLFRVERPSLLLTFFMRAARKRPYTMKFYRAAFWLQMILK
ncbi:MAG: hypothetical protein EA344_12055 [Alkalicoccus sp.]|nr:MAG: hypothetical protein EA344_12055 [Alkalicoccus sp.]